jgi:hypothetical protein
MAVCAMPFSQSRLDHVSVRWRPFPLRGSARSHSVIGNRTCGGFERFSTHRPVGNHAITLQSLFRCSSSPLAHNVTIKQFACALGTPVRGPSGGVPACITSSPTQQHLLPLGHARGDACASASCSIVRRPRPRALFPHVSSNPLQPGEYSSPFLPRHSTTDSEKLPHPMCSSAQSSTTGRSAWASPVARPSLPSPSAATRTRDTPPS